MERALLALGALVITPGAVETIEEYMINWLILLNRRATGDWRDLDEQDKRENDLSVQKGSRVLSAYGTGEGKLYVITEADRSVTTVLRPDEY